MNRPHIVALIVGAGLLLVLALHAPDLGAGTLYAVAMSVSFLGPDKRRVDLGTASSFSAASDLMYQDSIERAAQHGDVRYGSSSEGVAASYEDGTILIYQFEPADAEDPGEAAAASADNHEGTETPTEAQPDSATDSGSTSTSWPIHEVAWVEPTPFLRLQLKRVDIPRRDGSAPSPFWTLVFGKPGSADLVDPAIHPSQIPALVSHLTELYATWVLHTHEPKTSSE